MGLGVCIVRSSLWTLGYGGWSARAQKGDKEAKSSRRQRRWEDAGGRAIPLDLLGGGWSSGWMGVWGAGEATLSPLFLSSVFLGPPAAL